MTTFHTISSLRQALKDLRVNKRIALVPTMGNLHEGHLQLVKTAKQYADIVVVSIFVNPTQFGVGEDFDSYPRTLTDDVAKLTSVDADFVFAPSVDEMYPTFPPHTSINVGTIAEQLCGHSRPTHFAGVGLVVSKLFNIIQPDVAVFGKKDYQQLAIIRQLVAELNYPIEIIGADIVRADDGLALSSRNQYLDDASRSQAPQLRQALQALATKLSHASIDEQETLIQQSKDALNQAGFTVDYLELRNCLLQPASADDHNLVILVAAWLGGKTRLLDNLEFTRD